MVTKINAEISGAAQARNTMIIDSVIPPVISERIGVIVRSQPSSIFRVKVVIADAESDCV